MKIPVTFKTPDVIDDAIKETVEDAKREMLEENNYQELSFEQKEILESMRYTLQDFFAHFVEYGEQVTIEFETDGPFPTANVKRVK